MFWSSQNSITREVSFLICFLCPSQDHIPQPPQGPVRLDLQGVSNVGQVSTRGRSARQEIGVVCMRAFEGCLSLSAFALRCRDFLASLQVLTRHTLCTLLAPMQYQNECDENE